MTRIKLLSIITLLAIIAGSAVVIPQYLQKQKAKEENRKRIEARSEDLKRNNPELYSSIIQAIEKNKEEVSKNKKNQPAWIELGTNYQHIGDYLSAENAYRTALSLSTDAYIPWDSMANMYIEQGQYDTAERIYLDWIKATKEPDAYIKLARMYYDNKSGSLEDAINILRRGIQETSSKKIADTYEYLIKNNSM